MDADKSRTTTGIVASRRDDVVATIAREAPPLSPAARARIALLIRPAVQR